MVHRRLLAYRMKTLRSLVEPRKLHQPHHVHPPFAGFPFRNDTRRSAEPCRDLNLGQAIRRGQEDTAAAPTRTARPTLDTASKLGVALPLGHKAIAFIEMPVLV